MANCFLQDSYGIQIGDLCRHKKLIELNLSGNKFEENGCIFIGNALSTYNRIFFFMVKNYFFLAENMSLSYLNLSWNLIRSYGSIALFRGMEVKFFYS